MNDQQAGINANRKHDDPAIRQWARGKQRLANAERNQFRASLTDGGLEQIEERIEQLIHENPALSVATIRTLDSNTAPPSVPVEVLEEIPFSERHGLLTDIPHRAEALRVGRALRNYKITLHESR